MQVIADRFGVQRGTDRKHVLQKIDGDAEGDQRSPFGFEIEQFGCDVLGKELRQRTEGFALAGMATAAVQPRTGNRHVAEWRAEADHRAALARLDATTFAATPAFGGKGCGLRRHDMFLQAAKQIFGLGERKPDRFKLIMRFIEAQNLLLANGAVVGCDPQLDLNLHRMPSIRSYRMCGEGDRAMPSVAGRR